MKKHWKDYLIGFLAACLLFVLMGSGTSGDTGKYQVSATGTKQYPAYIIIDTETGDIVKTGYFGQ